MIKQCLTVLFAYNFGGSFKNLLYTTYFAVHEFSAALVITILPNLHEPDVESDSPLHRGAVACRGVGFQLDDTALLYTIHNARM
jgi:hypothetical protein